MSNSEFQNLREYLGMSRTECATYLGLKSAEDLVLLENGNTDIHSRHRETLARLDSIIETAVLTEVDLFTQIAERDIVLIRFLNDDQFALYEPDLFESFGSASVHGAFINRTKLAIERIGGDVTVAFMDSEFYEAWLGVNDFDDSLELRISWARQQIKGLAK